MTFPSTLKKSGPITISKTRTGSGSKSSSQGLTRSPVSPLNTPVQMIASGSSVKSSTAIKNHEKTSVVTTVKKVVSGSSINPASKSVIKPVTDVNSESVKPVTSAAKVVAKSTTKPPPLKLNLKVTNASGLQKSPVTPKSVPKTPTTPTSKKIMTKSPTVSKSVSAAKSPLLSGVKAPTSPLNKLNNVLTANLAVKKSVDTKSSTVHSTSKSSSSPVTKSPKESVSKTSAASLPVAKTQTSVVPKTTVPIKLSPPTVKSFVSKTVVKENCVSSSQSKAVIVKPSVPVKKTTILSTKNATGEKLLITANKSSTTPKSPTMVSSIKSISPKVPNSPSKLLSKESKSVKTSNSLATKPNAISKSGSSVLKVIVSKEPSTLSSSLPKTSLIQSTSSVVSKPATSKPKLTSSTVNKSLVPKSPITKTRPSAVAVIPSSPTVKTPSPSVKTITPMSPSMKTKTPSSPTVKSRTTSISAKPPMSPARQKLLPTKLLLSPTKSKLLSFSTESLTPKTPLKSPMNLKPVPKSPLKVTKKPTAKVPIAKVIRGGQPVKKSVIVTETNELLTNEVCNKSETSDVCKLENIVKNDSQEAIESAAILNETPLFFETFKTVNTEVNIDDCSKTTDTFVNVDVSLNAENVDKSVSVEEHSVECKEDKVTVEFSSLTSEEQKQDENMYSQLDFVVVTKDDCVPQLNSISQSSNSCNVFVENYFNNSSENIVKECLDEVLSCTVKMEESFELMNDKLVLEDVGFETDSNQSDVSDSEHATMKKTIEIVPSEDEVQKHCIDDVFTFTNTEDLSFNDLDRADSVDDFMHQLMPKSGDRSEGTSSIGTDEESLIRKSYSEAVLGSPKDGEFDCDYDFNLADDCLDYDDDSSVFVEVTEKEFPELKPKDLSCKRRNKKQKKRNCSNRTESLSDSNSSSEEINYNPEDFDGNEFSHYIKMMKDCSFYPNGLFSSDSVKLSSSTSLSWLDISVRTTDDDLIPSTESLSTHEIFQASNLNKDFLMSVIGCSNAATPSNESSWSWKSIEGRHQSHIKTNITLSLQPRPKHLTTPRFMLLLALISEAKGYEIQPSLSEHFVTTDCMPRFDYRIRRLMVQGFWMVGRLINESLSENEETNCGNPFGFVDGDLGYWWAGIQMLDWQEYLKECGKTQELRNCYQFVVENNMDGKRHYSSEALLSMGAGTPEEFMSESDMENFVHSVRNVKYYCGNCFVESEENLEKAMNVDGCDDENDLVEWENGSIALQN